MKVSKNLLFLKKKNRAAGRQKNFWSRDCGVGPRTATRPREQKFFGSFFQKRTFFLEFESDGRFFGALAHGQDAFMVCKSWMPAFAGMTGGRVRGLIRPECSVI
jgi:hypothetical protein